MTKLELKIWVALIVISLLIDLYAFLKITGRIQ